MIKPGPWRPFIVKAVIVTAVLCAGFSYAASRYRLGIDWQVERCLPDTRVVLIDLHSSLPEQGWPDRLSRPGAGALLRGRHPYGQDPGGPAG